MHTHTHACMHAHMHARQVRFICVVYVFGQNTKSLFVLFEVPSLTHSLTSLFLILYVYSQTKTWLCLRVRIILLYQVSEH